MILSEYSPLSGTTIKLVSLSGQLIQYLRNTDSTGDVLTCVIESVKNGGVDTLTFSVGRDTNIPIFTGLIVEVYKDGSLLAIAYSNTIPQPQSDTGVLEVSCLGYSHKLEESTVNKSYASITLEDIIADLEDDLAEVDIFYDAAKIVLPSITISELEFDDKEIYDIIDTVLNIANVDFLTEQYRWFIDETRTLNFELMSNDPIRTLFEGYDYQSPEVEDDDTDIVNKILAYKTDSVDTSTVNYVDTYVDTDSQGKYGIRDRKIVFPDSIDVTTLESYCTAIIEENKTPKTKASVSDLEGVDFPFSFYKLSNKIDTYWIVMSECDSFDDWDISGAVTTTVELSEEQVLTGRKSIKCTTAEGSIGESITLTMESPVFGSSLFRFYLFLEEQMNISVILLGSDGAEYSFSLGISDLKLKINDTVSTTKSMEVTTGGIDYGVTVSVQVAYVDDWLKVEVDASAFSITGAMIEFNTDSATSVYIDRLELKARSYFTNTLMLEKITQTLTKDYSISDAEFGDKFPNLQDEIGDSVSDGDVALSIFSKQ